MEGKSNKKKTTIQFTEELNKINSDIEVLGDLPCNRKTQTNRLPTAPVHHLSNSERCVKYLPCEWLVWLSADAGAILTG